LREYYLIDDNFDSSETLGASQVLVRQANSAFGRVFQKFPIGVRIPPALEKKCVIIGWAIFLWELFALMDPSAIRVSLINCVQSSGMFYNSFYCPCGMVNNAVFCIR